MVRYILKENSLKFSDIAFDNKSFAEILLTPTKIYVKSILQALKTKKIKALAHITGGGIVENLPRVLSKNLQAKVNYQAWEMPKIFKLLQSLSGVSDEEIRRTFNCGIGMVVVVKREDVDQIKEILIANGEEVFEIGELV